MKDGKRLVNHNVKKCNKLEYARTLKKRLLMRNIEHYSKLQYHSWKFS